MNVNLFSVGRKPGTAYFTDIAQLVQRLFRKMSALKKLDRVFVEDVIQVVTQEIPSPYIILN